MRSIRLLVYFGASINCALCGAGSPAQIFPDVRQSAVATPDPMSKARPSGIACASVVSVRGLSLAEAAARVRAIRNRAVSAYWRMANGVQDSRLFDIYFLLVVDRYSLTLHRLVIDSESSWKTPRETLETYEYQYARQLADGVDWLLLAAADFEKTIRARQIIAAATRPIIYDDVLLTCRIRLFLGSGLQAVFGSTCSPKQ